MSGISDQATAISLIVPGFCRKAAPIAPPGWFRAKTPATLGCSSSAAAMATASPTASATVVDVVGADTPNEDVSDSCTGAGSSTVPGLAWIRSHVWNETHKLRCFARKGDEQEGIVLAYDAEIAVEGI
ncbi:hypothetical protein HYQ46_007222 [Verticillium longisporum]|nr:hypothetical protein HYQ46_007222 [Verticillium longisporum]